MFSDRRTSAKGKVVSADRTGRLLLVSWRVVFEREITFVNEGVACGEHDVFPRSMSAGALERDHSAKRPAGRSEVPVPSGKLARKRPRRFATLGPAAARVARADRYFQSSTRSHKG